MRKFEVVLLISVILLWLPLLIAGVIGCFSPIEIGYKITYIVVCCLILIPITPILLAYLDTRK